ncbi:hypothetical protein Bbelb_053240 [Branchiostoma belcheri]|nr:hypothetical protein Bbelb_053240 [Branchiostoma belcheri]
MVESYRQCLQQKRQGRRNDAFLNGPGRYHDVRQDGAVSRSSGLRHGVEPGPEMCSLVLLRGLGACQAVCGVVAVWLGTLEILTAWTPYPGVSTLPIGCGIMFVLVGALGLLLTLDDTCAACMMGLLTIQSTLNCLLLAPLACISAVLGVLHTCQTRAGSGDTSTHDWHLHLEIGIICACVVEAGAAGVTAVLCGCCEIFGCREKTNVETVALKETTQANMCKGKTKCMTNVPVSRNVSDAKKARSQTHAPSRVDGPDRRKSAAAQRSAARPLDVLPPKRSGLRLFVGRAESCSNGNNQLIFIHPFYSPDSNAKQKLVETLEASRNRKTPGKLTLNAVSQVTTQHHNRSAKRSGPIGLDTSTAVQPRITLEELGSFQQTSESRRSSVVETWAPEAPLPGSTQDSIELTACGVQTLPMSEDKTPDVTEDEESASRRPPVFLKPLDSARIPPRLVRNRLDPEHVGSTASFVSLDGSSCDLSPIWNSNDMPGRGERRPPVRKPLPPPSVLKTSTVLPAERSPDFYKPDGFKTHKMPPLDNSKPRDFDCPQDEDVETFTLRRDSLETFEEDAIPSKVMTKSTMDKDERVRNDMNDVPLTAITKKPEFYSSSGSGARSSIPSTGGHVDGVSTKIPAVTEESLMMLDAVDRELDEAETLIQSGSRRQCSAGLRRADEYSNTTDKSDKHTTAHDGSEIMSRLDPDVQKGRVLAVSQKPSLLLENEGQPVDSMKARKDHSGQYCLSVKRAASFDLCKKDDVTDVERELAEAEQLIQRSSELENGMTDRPSGQDPAGASPVSAGRADVDEHMEAAETLIQMYEVTEALQKAMALRNLPALEAAITAVQRAGVEDKVKHEINRANKLLLSLRQLDKLKQEVLKLRQSTVSEIRSYNKPHPAVKTVMTAVYLLLGTREKDTENWQSVQILLSKAGAEGLKRRVSACNVAKIPVAVANRSRQFLGKYNLDEIRDVSAGAATLYLWATGVVQEVRDRAREQRQLNFLSPTSSSTADTDTT